MKHAPIHLPLRYERVEDDLFMVIDADDTIICDVRGEDVAQFVVTACNMLGEVELIINNIDRQGEDAAHETAYTVLRIVREALAKAGK